MTDRMRAVVLRGAGGPEVMTIAEVPRPVPREGEILVRVAAAGVNRADLLQRMGRYPAPPGAPADIPGLEFAGVVEDAGGGSSSWRVGDRVMGITSGGAYAEYVVVPAGNAVRIPERWSFEQAAAIPEAFMTAHDALGQVRLSSRERVLVHAVGSGVGVALLQLLKLRDCTVAGTSRTASKLERARALGLDRPILVEKTFAPGPDLEGWAQVVCDLVGAPYLGANLAVLAPQGRIIVIGLTGGQLAKLDMGSLMRKRATLVGTVLRGRSDAEKAEVTAGFGREVLPQLESGTLMPVLDAVYSIEDVAAAHRYMESNHNFGSVVLAW